MRSSVSHIYTVEFRVSGRSLDPDEVTTALELMPAYVHRVGERIGRKTRETNTWVYNGYDDREQVEWPDLEEGLQFVLDRLWSRRHALEPFSAVAECYWWCGHFQSSFDGGPRLSPGLLSRLGQIGAALCIDNYFSADP